MSLFASKLRRRLVTIPALVAGSAVLVGLAPVCVPALGLYDLLSGRGARARTYLMVTAYGVSEVLAVLASGALFFVGRADDAPLHVELQSWWTRTLLAIGARLYRLKVVVEDDRALDGGPMLLLMRHSSIGDTVIPSVFVTQRRGIPLRYVLKRELLLDPALDVVGHRIANYFVDRESTDTAREREGVRALVEGLADAEGVVIYPEGTVFDAQRREAALARLERRGATAELARARALTSVLPPRVGGTLSLLEANRGLDVVFCAHVGFEGAVGFKSLASGGWMDQTVRIRFRRVPFAELPTTREGRAEFLWSEWERMDEEVRELHARNAESSTQPRTASSLATTEAS